jgi:hypothetical protein
MTKPSYLANKMQGVLDAHAYRADKAMVARLLDPLPAAIGTGIVKGLREKPAGFASMRFDENSESAYFIVADTMILHVWTFRPIKTLEQAATLWAEIDSRRAGGELARAMLVAAFSAVTGLEVTSARDPQE